MGRTDFLFASPSFLTGAARTFDLCGSLEAYSYNYSRSPAEADLRAIGSDWQVVGKDLERAIKTVTERTEK